MQIYDCKTALSDYDDLDFLRENWTIKKMLVREARRKCFDGNSLAPSVPRKRGAVAQQREIASLASEDPLDWFAGYVMTFRKSCQGLFRLSISRMV